MLERGKKIFPDGLTLPVTLLGPIGVKGRFFGGGDGEDVVGMFRINKGLFGCLSQNRNVKGLLCRGE